MLTSGTILGERYEIIEKIGAGGMSIVYKAKDMRLQRFVAIKELREEFVQDEEFVNKFRKEALSAASLSHPNIVGIYDVGSDQEVHYIVMEYIEGKTLKEVIATDGPFDSKTVLELGVQMVSALKHAHQKKIIHRDIKPQNILMTNDGVLKVTDFGIAKAVDSSTIVATGNAIGSVHYFSPEQAKGKYVNESSDLYSCGIVLFELATKCLPFEADSHISIALKHINEEFPKPSSINPQIPENLENIILRATAKNQADRYQNADEMLRDMRGILQNPSYQVSLSVAFAEKTILLSPEETKMLRASDPEEVDEVESTAAQTGEAPVVPHFEEKAIYEDEVGFSDEEEDGEVSTFYKVIVSIGGVLATLALVVAITLACVFWIPSLTNGKTYSVPDVINKTQEEAETLIKKSKLKVKVVEVETDEAEEGIVVGQNPTKGTVVKKNSEVEIQVAVDGDGSADSEEVEEVEVPDFKNLLVNDVMVQLNELGLQLGEPTYEYSDTVEFGCVVSQSPVAGSKVEKGTMIDLVISQGAEKQGATVPNLYGMSVSEAESALRTVGLVLGSQAEEENEAPAGTIIRQSLSIGTVVDKDTRVNVTISKGPASAEEPSPAPSDMPTETTEPTQPTEPDPEPEAPEISTQSISVSLPAGTEVKESYRVIAKLTLDDGTTSTQEQVVPHDQFPVSFSFQGSGTGIVDVFIDGVSASQDSIIF